MGKSTQPTMCYPQSSQHAQWKDDAKECGMSLSEYIQAMVEAGRKKFEVSVEPDETNTELRRERNDLLRELADTRERVNMLERERHDTEESAVVSFIEENPGCSWSEIARDISESAGKRVSDHLDRLEGYEIESREDGYYPADES